MFKHLPPESLMFSSTLTADEASHILTLALIKYFIISCSWPHNSPINLLHGADSLVLLPRGEPDPENGAHDCKKTEKSATRPISSADHVTQSRNLFRPNVDENSEKSTQSWPQIGLQKRVDQENSKNRQKEVRNSFIPISTPNRRKNATRNEKLQVFGTQIQDSNHGFQSQILTFLGDNHCILPNKSKFSQQVLTKRVD